jgi:MFS family permease
MSNRSYYQGYKWVMLVLTLLVSLLITENYMFPAPILPVFMKDLNIDITQAGLVISIIGLMFGFGIIFGSFVVQKLGIKNTMVVGLWFATLGIALAYFSNNIKLLLVGRIISGVGAGFMNSAVNPVFFTWFSEKERPMVIVANTVVGGVAMYVAMGLTVPIFNAVGSWQNVFLAVGIFAVILAILWTLFSRDNVPVGPSVSADQADSAGQAPEKQEIGLKLALKSKQIWILTIGTLGVVWAYSTASTFLPTFFGQIRGFDLAQAGSLTGMISIGTIIGTIVFGSLTSAIGLRKPLMITSILLLLVGALGTVLTSSTLLLYVLLTILGIGFNGFITVAQVAMMEVKGMNALMITGAVAMMFGFPYIVAFFLPMIFGPLAGSVGMVTAMVIFMCVAIPGLICQFALYETGPKKKTIVSSDLNMN